nr:MAG TPA: hypothetical protein [Inoviridae sp.]
MEKSTYATNKQSSKKQLATAHLASAKRQG